MKILHLLAIGLAAGVMVAACDNGSTNTLQPGGHNAAGDDDDDDDSTTTTKPGSSSGGTSTGSTDPTDPSAGTVNAPPASADGKAFYKSDVHPILSSKCGSCHGASGPGPNWLTAADADKSYAQILQQGYVVPQSRITLKGAHGGVTTNVLTSTEIATYNTFVSKQNTAAGGAAATPNVLAALGGCFDRTKFDAMQMQNWQTTRRTNNNNTNNVTPWNENANNCTGCNNAPCSTCHSADAATNFVNAVGSPIFPADYTFNETKKTQPAYISKFFGIGPDGKPIASNGIQKKSDATMKDKAYTHPMFNLTAQQKTAIDAFVNDTIASYAAGKCPATTTAPPK